MKPFLIILMLFVVSCMSTATITPQQKLPCIRIEVKTINFNKPVITNQIIGVLGVCDDDINQKYKWSIINGNSNGYFQVKNNPANSKQALITTSGNQGTVNRLNKDNKTSYTFKVVVTDNGRPPRTSLPCDVIITVNTQPLP